MPLPLKRGECISISSDVGTVILSDVALSPIEKAICWGNSFVLIKYSIKYHFIEVHHTFMTKVVLDLKSFFPL